MGSKFSMEHMMTTLSFGSLISSSSNSFQLATDSSTRTVPFGDASRPHLTISSYSSLLYAMEPPVPPRVNDGLITAGNPTCSIARKDSSIDLTYLLLGIRSPIRSMDNLNRSRSSALLIASTLAPMSCTSNSSRTPRSLRATAMLSAVCPPIVGSRASGLSRSIIFATNSGINGSIYVLSANSGSVMMVAGFELTRMTRYPSSFSALQACVPE